MTYSLFSFQLEILGEKKIKGKKEVGRFEEEYAGTAMGRIVGSKSNTAYLMVWARESSSCLSLALEKNST